MPNTKIKELETMVAKLHAERQGHVDAIAEIDAAFDELGIAPGAAPKRRGRPPGRKPKRVGKKRVGKKRRPGKGKGRTGTRYPVSGTNSIYGFVKKAGRKGAGGGEIDKHWKSEGRAGSAYNILGQLVKAKKVMRRNLKGQRGSVYIAT